MKVDEVKVRDMTAGVTSGRREVCLWVAGWQGRREAVESTCANHP